jgi:tRNA threonylcarbamoyladenosine biosynthesis protein TsaB
MFPVSLLSLDTTTEAGSCALYLRGEVVQRHCPPGQSHSETLLPLVRQLLAEAGIGLSALDGIAFGAGPGSFTGLRVACGAAQGLAVACNLPLLPVGSLAALAWGAAAPRVLVALDARMGEVYWGRYARTVDGVTALADPQVLPPASVLAELPETGDWVACGNGLTAYPELAERLTALGVPQLPQIAPDAALVAALAAPALVRGEGIDPALAAPVYVRDKVALTVAERLARGGKA